MYCVKCRLRILSEHSLNHMHCRSSGGLKPPVSGVSPPLVKPINSGSTGVASTHLQTSMLVVSANWMAIIFKNIAQWIGDRNCSFRPVVADKIGYGTILRDRWLISWSAMVARTTELTVWNSVRYIFLTPHAASILALPHFTRCLTPSTPSLYMLRYSTRCFPPSTRLSPQTASLHSLLHPLHCLQRLLQEWTTSCLEMGLQSQYVLFARV